MYSLSISTSVQDPSVTATSPSGNLRPRCLPHPWSKEKMTSIAQRYVDVRLSGEHIAAQVALNFDAGYARRVADAYHDAQTNRADADPRPLYGQLATETRRQYEMIVAAGLEIEPWRGNGQPYASGRDLIRRVLATGRLYIYLTSVGHGPAERRVDDDDHPLRKYAGVEAGGVPLMHNDLFRAVHDLFGHVMPGNGFDVQGEFCATYSHQRMYSRAVHPVLFSETIGQICWFFYGPHLLDRWGIQARRGNPGYVRLASRPYPIQKATALPSRLLEEFNSCFDEPPS